MILLVDVGNTRIKWSCLSQSDFFNGGHAVHHKNLSPEWFRQNWSRFEHVTAVWVVNVAGAVLAEQIRKWSLVQWRLEPHFVLAAKQLGGVTNGYLEPDKLGADRWVAMLGADRMVQGPCCVADCGSAVTVDCMNASHEHLGGLILPGLSMMSRCVSENTVQVTYESGDIAWLGKDTASCLSSGAIQSITGTLQRMAELMEQRFSSPINRIITGGDAPQLLPWLGKEWVYEPDLIFIGLTAALQHQKG